MLRLNWRVALPRTGVCATIWHRMGRRQTLIDFRWRADGRQVRVMRELETGVPAGSWSQATAQNTRPLTKTHTQRQTHRHWPRLWHHYNITILSTLDFCCCLITSQIEHIGNPAALAVKANNVVHNLLNSQLSFLFYFFVCFFVFVFGVFGIFIVFVRFWYS